MNIKEAIDVAENIGFVVKAGASPSTENRDAILALAAEVRRLQTELSKFQESRFHPDWSMLEACRESLREHMQMVKDLQEERDQLRAAIDEAEKQAAKGEE